MEKRKGARAIKDIPADILVQLNNGQLSSANLTEWLAIDQRKLLVQILTDLDRLDYKNQVLQAIDGLSKQTVNTINQCIGQTLFNLAQAQHDTLLFTQLKTHNSDLVRCWATYFIGFNATMSIEQKLEAIKYFAADTHFGVREICWLAVRADIILNLEASLKILYTWTTDDSEFVRRFATEATRPRGVWCPHIEQLKANPALGLPLLEAMKMDSSKYVRDSVGNWLNDAAKTQPDFVRNLCAKWESESQSKEIQYVVKKAMRSL